MKYTTVIIMFSLLAFMMIGSPLETSAGAAQPLQRIDNPSPVIHIETTMSSWRTRGRVSFALEPVVRSKLTAAGLQVAPLGQEGGALRLLVEYREERGQQVSLDIYGTEVTCRFTLEHFQRGRLLSLAMTESPGYGSLSTLPYVDVIQRLETNPYFYFLGDIVRGSLNGVDTVGALIQGIAKDAAADSGGQASEGLSESMQTLPSFEPQYRTRAMERAIEELAQLKEPRARPLLGQLLTHSDWRLRLRAVLALDSIGPGSTGDIMVTLSRIAEHDRNTDVREAARRTLARVGEVPAQDR